MAGTFMPSRWNANSFLATSFMMEPGCGFRKNGRPEQLAFALGLHDNPFVFVHLGGCEWLYFLLFPATPAPW